MNHSIFLVVDLDEFPKTTRIIVVGCFGIAESLKIKNIFIFSNFLALFPRKTPYSSIVSC